MNENRVIFSWYRAGTKLLADAHVAAGYFNFGEFFNVFSCEMIDAPTPYAKRLPVSIQYSERQQRQLLPESEMIAAKSLEIGKRIDVFNQFSHISPSIVTMWFADTYYNPLVGHTVDERYYLCNIRRNQTEQFLSSLLTIYNLNYNGEIESKPIHVDMHYLEIFYRQFHETNKIQKEIVKIKKGRYIDFDKLITGQEDLGFDYVVTSTDQHNDVYKLILNLKEVLDKIHHLQAHLS
jgi:hypothetical protein